MSKEIRQVLLPLKRDVVLELPTGAHLLSVDYWKRVYVLTFACDPTAHDEGRALHLVQLDDIDKPTDGRRVPDDGVYIDTVVEYGWGRTWVVYDLGPAGVKGQKPKTTPYSPDTLPEALTPSAAAIDDLDTVRYYHHAESGCVGRLAPGEPWPDEPLCEPITHKEYVRLSAEYDDL